jgi:hypothetical protein
MCEQRPEEELPLWDRRRPAGFRLWPSDAVVLVVAGAATPVLWRLVGSIALLLPLVVGHFFLFCNLFRVRRWAELAWTGLLLVNACAWLLLGEFTVPRIFLAQAPLTLAVILIALLGRGYRGVGYSLVRRMRRTNGEEQ